MTDKQQDAKDEAGPDGIYRPGRATDAPSDDTEAHGRPEEPGAPGSEEAWRPGRLVADPTDDDAPAPGPDGAYSRSDRNIKHGIVPVTW